MDYQTLNLLFRCNKEFSHGKIRLQELSDTECMICTYIYSHDMCSQEDVSVALKTDKTTVGKALASLEKRKVVTRVVDSADKRFRRLSLTEEGRGKISELLNIHNNWLDQIMTCLSNEEQLNFENYCKRLLCEAEKLTKNNGGKTN